MSEAVSALQGADYAGTATVREMGLTGMITLRGDHADAKLKKAVKAATGAALPAQRKAEMAGDAGALWMSPDELMLLVGYEAVGETLDKLEAALEGAHFLAVNVSDARALFEVKGPGAREVIAKLCPVDMSEAAFAPGDFRRTRMAQAAAAFWMVDAETIRIICFRSVAEYVFGLLKDAAEPGGEVGFF
ncbi:MAG: sarcosine oxidase subunit gamma family protein [Roseovarius sp.]